MSFDDLIGAPWLEGGRDLTEGFDCYGIVLEGLDRIGVPMLDVWDRWKEQYAEGWRDYVEAVPAGWKWVPRLPKKDLREGDILVTRDRGVPRHLSLVVRVDGQLRVLTALAAYGVMLLSIDHAHACVEGVVRRVDE